MPLSRITLPQILDLFGQEGPVCSGVPATISAPCSAIRAWTAGSARTCAIVCCSFERIGGGMFAGPARVQ